MKDGAREWTAYGYLFQACGPPPGADLLWGMPENHPCLGWVTYAHLWLQVFFFAKLPRCSYLSCSEMTLGDNISQENLVALISDPASLPVRMALNHLSESAPDGSKTDQETDLIQRWLHRYEEHIGVHRNEHLPDDRAIPAFA